MISSKINIDQLTDLLAASGHGPQVYYQPLPPGRLAARLWEAVQAGDYDLVTHFDGQRLMAAASMGLLDWDTEFFGFPCAQIDTLAARGSTAERYLAAREVVGQVLEACCARHVRFLSIKLPGPDPALVQALESHGFYTTNINLCLAWTGESPGPHRLPESYRFTASIPDPKAITASFRRLFYDGRFHNDPRIQVETADRLWEAAIRNQLDKEADQMLFIQKEDRIVGLATVKSTAKSTEQNEIGSLFVFGIAQGFRGQKLGKALLNELLSRLRGRYQRLDVETSTFNLPAINTYRQCGFQAVGAKTALHWWREDD